MLRFLPLTHKGKLVVTATIMCIVSAFFTAPVQAQIYCENETIFWSEDFGTGNTVGTNANVIGLNYQATGQLNDGYYRVTNTTEGRTEWHSSGNHTPGDANGRMLLVNGNGENFFRRVISSPEDFVMGNYAASLYLMNVNELGTCGATALLPTITFTIEYSTSANGNGNWQPLSSATATAVAQSANPVWKQLGSVFQLNVPGVKRLRVTLNNGTSSGCGNDFAIDDIQIATCPEGAPLPVQFMGINAAQKGSGVVVTWATSFEQDNNYFNVERSTDGANWEVVNSVQSKGNSNTIMNYSALDAKPAAGVNLYRIKQFDLNGRVSTSSIAKVNVEIDKTSASVLTNPFQNNITLDFLSKESKNVVVRLFDMAGKTIFTETLKVNSGNSRIQLHQVARLHAGMYVLSITDSEGNAVLNTKLIKR